MHTNRTNYFIDTEFIEGFHTPLFGKKRHHIDLISIAIVCEDGRRYEAISREYKYEDASDWVKENVIRPLYLKCIGNNGVYHRYTEQTFHKIYGKPNNQIAKEIFDFVNPQIAYSADKYKEFINGSNDLAFEPLSGYHFTKPVFWGYFADYDWVLFCSLWGTMMSLPAGFPMYCRDLKQELDTAAEEYAASSFSMGGLIPFDKKIELIKQVKSYPKQTNEHLAIADALWNFELYKFIIEKKYYQQPKRINDTISE